MGIIFGPLLDYLLSICDQRGHLPQNFDCELEKISADSINSAVHARENHLMLACYVSKLQSFKFHTHAFLGFEISTFISVL